ncbi:MAG TPA: NAD-dependent epimerase/dehydratase family protein, partial [Phototrophicaceae bacterium]|nr:NAD-dependent epimerase/dehydratase family protein [Phototrophicaceae bacterium]
MRALVTGGTGFVGSHVARALIESGHEVRILHRASSKLTTLEGVLFESAIGDILDRESLRAACQGCDWVFHVAAIADYWRADQSRMFEANVEGTRRVLEASREAGVKRVIFTSSAAAIGILPGQSSSESVAFNLSPSHFPYGYSKVLAERVVQDAVAVGQDVITLNPGVVMGPGDLNMISGSFITQIRQFGILTPMTNGGVGVVDVRDVARWQVLAAEKGISGERYILSTANYSYQDWFAMIADTVGVSRPILTVPAFILPLAAWVIDILRRYGISTPVDADQVRLGGRYVYFDTTKTWSAFGKPQ